MKNTLLALSFAAVLSLGLQTGIPAIDHALIKGAAAVEMHSASPIETAGSASRIARRSTRKHQKHYVYRENQVTTLPSGCTAVHKRGGTYYNCGSVYYQAVFQGNSVVYIVVDKP